MRDRSTPSSSDSAGWISRRGFTRRIAWAMAAVSMGTIGRLSIAVEKPKADAKATNAHEADDAGLHYTALQPYRMRLTLNVGAPQSALQNVVAICPYPIDWPEQTVKLLEEHKSPGVRIKETPLKGMGALLTMSVPEVRRGASAFVERIYEVKRSIVKFTRDTNDLERPDANAVSLKDHLGVAPGIDPKADEIVKLSKSLRDPMDRPWETAHAYYTWIRQNIRFELGDYRGASKALEQRIGDCEDFTALFLALCRADRIPARTVWIEAHAYPEFYLKAKEKDAGWWIPAQLAGNAWFGEMKENRVILQKGDSIANPITHNTVRYIPHTCKAIGGVPLLTCERVEVESVDGKPE